MQADGTYLVTLENGNIKNSVNYPACDMGICTKVGRVAIFHKNIANMITKFTALFGDDVALLVQGVTKLDKLQVKSEASKQAENFQKFVLAISEDIRVLLIKFTSPRSPPGNCGRSST